jgi:hypothetical protein
MALPAPRSTAAALQMPDLLTTRSIRHLLGKDRRLAAHTDHVRSRGTPGVHLQGTAPARQKSLKSRIDGAPWRALANVTRMEENARKDHPDTQSGSAFTLKSHNAVVRFPRGPRSKTAAAPSRRGRDPPGFRRSPLLAYRRSWLGR